MVYQQLNDLQAIRRGMERRRNRIKQVLIYPACHRALVAAGRKRQRPRNGGHGQASEVASCDTRV